MLEATWLQSRALAAVIALLGLCGLLVGGCASTVVQAQWADPLFVGQSLRGATMLVVCNAYAPAIQRICQDQISGRMLKSGIRPVMATEADLITAQGEQIIDKIFAAARGTGSVSCNSAFILHLCCFLHQEDFMEREAMVQNP